MNTQVIDTERETSISPSLEIKLKVTGPDNINHILNGLNTRRKDVGSDVGGDLDQQNAPMTRLTE